MKVAQAPEVDQAGYKQTNTHQCPSDEGGVRREEA